MAFFHFAKCIYRRSAWVNFNWQLPSILYNRRHSNALLPLLKLACVKARNYLLNTGSTDWINNWPRRWGCRWTVGSAQIQSSYNANWKIKIKKKQRLFYFPSYHHFLFNQKMNLQTNANRTITSQQRIPLLERLCTEHGGFFLPLCTSSSFLF